MRSLGAAFVGLCVFGVAGAQGAAPPNASQRESSRAELSRLREIHLLNLLGEDLGHLAEQRGHQLSVRTLGTCIAENHARVDARLLSTAQRMGWDLNVTERAPEQARVVEKQLRELGELSSEAFDGQFLTDFADNAQAVIGEMKAARGALGGTALATALDHGVSVLQLDREQALNLAKNRRVQARSGRQK